MGARSVVLVGLPGAGKSTVGPLVAARLTLPFVDLDRVIERAAGMTVAEIFSREGEAGFRARERLATREVVRPVVLAPGGGWLEDPANLQSLGDDALTVYLRASVEVALRRIAASGERRPLLEVPDPALALKKLLARREARYLQSDHTVSVDSRTPGEVASSIVALVSGSGGD